MVATAGTATANDNFNFNIDDEPQQGVNNSLPTNLTFGKGGQGTFDNGLPDLSDQDLLSLSDDEIFNLPNNAVRELFNRKQQLLASGTGSEEGGGFGQGVKEFFTGSSELGPDGKTIIQNDALFKPLAQGALGIGKLALGFKQLGQSERALDLQQDQFNRNFGVQVDLVNRRLQDREVAKRLLQGQGQDQAESGARRHVEEFGVQDPKNK